MRDARLRYVPAPDGDTVLDGHTGLTWERHPAPRLVPWEVATLPHDPAWRLPSASELLVLLSGLPARHPFPEPAPGALFWSSTASPFSARGEVRAIGCQAGPLYVVRLLDRRATARVWRVRAQG